MTFYLGILDGSGDVWGVRIPDFSGVHGGGATPEAAIVDAISVMHEVAAYLRESGEALPVPRALSEVLGEAESGEVPVVLPLAVASS